MKQSVISHAHTYTGAGIDPDAPDIAREREESFLAHRSRQAAGESCSADCVWCAQQSLPLGDADSVPVLP